jgi:hypothetical protein
MNTWIIRLIATLFSRPLGITTSAFSIVGPMYLSYPYEFLLWKNSYLVTRFDKFIILVKDVG